MVSMTMDPDLTVSVENTSFPEGVFGYVLNGLSLQGGTAGGCNDDGDCIPVGANVNPEFGWSMEGLGESGFNFGFDENNAHVRGDGEYHYHCTPEAFVDGVDTTEGITLIGFAADGFPVYAGNGYSPDTWFIDSQRAKTAQIKRGTLEVCR